MAKIYKLIEKDGLIHWSSWQNYREALIQGRRRLSCNILPPPFETLRDGVPVARTLSKSKTNLGSSASTLLRSETSRPAVNMPQTRAQAKKEAVISSASPISTLFPKLPVEIRFQIWDLACQEQRVIGLWGKYVNPVWAHLESKKTQKEHALFPGKLQVQRFKPPSVLHVSREAREIGLKHYTLAFGTAEGSEYQVNEKGVHEPFIYVNWKVDIFFPTSPDAACGFVTKTKPERYRVAIDEIGALSFEPFLWKGGNQEYRYLEEVIVVVPMGNLTFSSIIRRLRFSRPINFDIQTPPESEIERNICSCAFEALQGTMELTESNVRHAVDWDDTIAETIDEDETVNPEAWEAAYHALLGALYAKLPKITPGLIGVN
ncbi:hypothetical protein HYFRA_00010502 [Hymenoscyphus fraxineus]|uniref:2EXR domain-containing protein n=1 Tax=Hymenoscyphus fraxineus TaxID=746836 RepID=A0A9N9PVV8_9HELO|nr:hypothetical protein HYFRA_00010502 [Hymenoscyphus fraxineus]